MNLFVARLNPSTKTKDLQKLFSHYGLVNTSKVIFDRGTGRSKCYGFIEMPNNNEAREALKELDNSSFQENIITVKESQSSDDRVSIAGEAGKRIVSPQYFRNNDRPEYKINAALTIKPQRDDNSRRNFGYRGGDYRSFI